MRDTRKYRTQERVPDPSTGLERKPERTQGSSLAARPLILGFFVVLFSSPLPSSPGAPLLRQLGYLHDIGPRLDVRGNYVEQYAGSRVVAHVDDLHGCHQLIHPDQSIGSAAGPAAHLEDIARRNTVLAALVDENHHLGLLEVLTPQTTDERPSYSVGHRDGPIPRSGIKPLEGKGALTVAYGSVGGDDPRDVVLVHCLRDHGDSGRDDHLSERVDLSA